MVNPRDQAAAEQLLLPPEVHALRFALNTENAGKLTASLRMLAEALVRIAAEREIAVATSTPTERHL